MHASEMERSGIEPPCGLYPQVYTHTYDFLRIPSKIQTPASPQDRAFRSRRAELSNPA